MKLSYIVFILVIVFVSAKQSKPHHEFLGLGDMNPLDLMRVMSGDFTALLPQSIQPLARKLLGKEEQTGAAGFLQQAQNLLGGNSGLDKMIGGQSAQSGMGSLLGDFGNLGNLGGLFGQEPAKEK